MTTTSAQRSGDRPCGNIDATRSPAVGRHGMIATSQSLASAAGLQVLQSGGNAVDAAVTAAAVLAVVEPSMNGIGGDLFAIVYDARPAAIHGSMPAAAPPPPPRRRNSRGAASRDAGERPVVRERARGGERLGRAAHALRHHLDGAGAGAGDPLGARRLPGGGTDGRRVAGRRRAARRRTRPRPAPSCPTAGRRRWARCSRTRGSPTAWRSSPTAGATRSTAAPWRWPSPPTCRRATA